MTHSYCTSCGTPHRPGNRFCVGCGQSVAPPTDTDVTLQAPAADAVPPRDPGHPAHPNLPLAGSIPFPPLGQPHTSSRRRGRTLVLGVAALLLIGSASAGVVVLTRGSEDEARAGAPRGAATQIGFGETTSLLGEPGDSWTVRGGDVMPGGSFQPFGYSYSASTAFVVGDSLVTQVVDSTGDDDAPSAIVGLRLRDGHQEFTIDGADYGSVCFPAALDRFACGTDDGFRLYDGEGGVVHRYGDMIVSDVLFDDSTTYLLSFPDADGTDSGYDTELTAVDPDDGRILWSTVLEDTSGPVDDGDSDIFDEGPEMRRVDAGISVAYGYLGWLVDEDGKLVRQEVDGVAPLGGDYTVDDAGTVSDASGMVVQRGDEPLWYGADGTTSGSVVFDGLLGSGTSIIDVATGDTVWEDTDADVDGTYYSWVDNGRYVVRSSYTEDAPYPATVVRNDGTHVQDYPYDLTSNVFTDDALATAGPGLVETRPLNGGEATWTRDVSDLVYVDDDGVPGAPTLLAAPDTLIVVGSEGITGFRDFAPRSDTDATQDAEPVEATDAGGTEYETDCGSEPEFTPISSTSGDGNLTVIVEITATCPAGQVLDSASTDVTITGVGGATYASGIFDFSRTPFVLPAPGTGDDDDATITLPLTFPADTVYATPQEVSDGIATDVVHVDCDQGPAGDAPGSPEPEAGADPGAAPTDDASGADPSQGGTATEPGAEGGRETALHALRRIARQDFTSVGDELVGQWVPQLSSKQRGENGDDGYFDYPAILAEHEALRLTYPNVKLLFSTRWNYERPGYWVTVTGTPSPGWRPALRSCADNGLDHKHCYAKLLYRASGPAFHTTWFLTEGNDRVPRNGPPQAPSYTP